MILSCHCENISIKAPFPAQLTICNCSICNRYQALWAYYQPEQVDISIGAEGSASYIWGDRVIEFIRCSSCGCVTHYLTLPGQSDPKVALNLRMVSAETIADLPIRYFDGKTLL